MDWAAEPAGVDGKGSVEDGAGRAQAGRAGQEGGPEGGLGPALPEGEPLPHRHRKHPTRARTPPTFPSQASLFSQ